MAVNKNGGGTGGKKKVSSSSKSARSRSNTGSGKRRAPADSEKQWSPVSLEITGLIIIAVSIFIVLSVYTDGKTGRLGAMLRLGFVGLFGIGAYILPVIVIGICLYILFSKEKSLPAGKYAASGVIFLSVIVYAHALTGGGESVSGAWDAARYFFLNGSAANGGAVGAAVGHVLIGFFSKPGTYVILCSSLVICFIAVTGKSFLRALARLVFFAGGFFTAKEYDCPPEEEYAPAAREARRADKSKRAEPGEGAPLAAPKFQKPSSSLEVTPSPFHALPAEGRIRLVSEDIKKRKPDKRAFEVISGGLGEPVININKPSVSLKVSGKGAAASAAGLDVPVDTGASEKEYEEKIYETMECETGESEGKGESETFVPSPAQDTDEYGVDILFNSAPAYEDEHIVCAQDDSPLAQDRPWVTVAPAAPVKAPAEASAPKNVIPQEYKHPHIELLDTNPSDSLRTSKAEILENSKKLEEALRSFKVEAKVMEVNVGPTVTRYELSPGVGVKVSSISNLSDDLALNLAAAGVRIEAPIPGKAAVGIEVPNKEAQPVYLREVIGDPKFANFPSKLAFALGKDIAGNVVVADIAKMPHMLIAGSTGSGKSVCINTLVTSIIYKSKPEEVKLLMVDPKVVELKVYNGVPHLLIPVVTDPKKAASALNWAVREMAARYDLFAETGVRDLKGYNQIREEKGEDITPQIVIIIDELADLMMTAGKEVEEYICRLAQMARAAGIHLIIATQRPSVDVITGLIKANIPSKIAFAVSSSIDSRTILGEGGAEKLLGRGDMLFYPMGMNKPIRVQGSFISDKEVETVVNYVKQEAPCEYDEKIIETITTAAPGSKNSPVSDADPNDDDSFVESAIEFIVKKEKASASMLQRQFRIGYNRASRLIEILEERGVVGPEDGSKPRKVLMGKLEWEDYNSRKMGL